ncbi:hypothetical protein CYMTET_40553 [Cymbomonas tetramitiformis]|uniref:Uncharacterized protein n=1 Tax=Cymbomonas tetramitiformis TaxID=36881 RepID=A0AAE0C939_9CHLO|nr:hypothetical protein CYMTET_40553 [Cymbomonas tetramitiformis]
MVVNPAALYANCSLVAHVNGQHQVTSALMRANLNPATRQSHMPPPSGHRPPLVAVSEAANGADGAPIHGQAGAGSPGDRGKSLVWNLLRPLCVEGARIQILALALTLALTLKSRPGARAWSCLSPSPSPDPTTSLSPSFSRTTRPRP